MRSGDGGHVRHRLAARVKVGRWRVEWREPAWKQPKVGINPAEHLAGDGWTTRGGHPPQEQVSLGLLGLHPATWPHLLQDLPHHPTPVGH